MYLDLRPSSIQPEEGKLASDAIGDAYEYMIGEFASQAGKKAVWKMVLSFPLSMKVESFHRMWRTRRLTIISKSPTTGDKQALQKQFERWWQKQSKSCFLVVIDKFYPIISKHGIDKPILQVRKMKTLWGSCSKKHSKINLNYYLYKSSAALY